MIRVIQDDSVLSDKFWPFNGIKNATYNRSDDSVSKFVNGFEYKWIAKEMWAIVEMVMILNFVETHFFTVIWPPPLHVFSLHRIFVHGHEMSIINAGHAIMIVLFDEKHAWRRCTGGLDPEECDKTW